MRVWKRRVVVEIKEGEKKEKRKMRRIEKEKGKENRR
jgi:hypothetical protein